MLPRLPPLHEGPRRLSWAAGIACALLPAAYFLLSVLRGGRLLDISADEAAVLLVYFIIWGGLFFFVPFLLIRLGARLFVWVKQGFDNPNDGAPPPRPRQP